MVERLVYTELVGGSIPSLPTIKNALWFIQARFLIEIILAIALAFRVFLEGIFKKGSHYAPSF